VNRRSDGGTAFLTALLAVAVFAYIALEILEMERGTVAVLEAESEQGRLVAAADAGLVQTIYQLGLKDGSQRLQPDGRTHSAYFDGVDLAIVAQDERGKVPLNSVGSDVERRLLAAAGVEGERLQALAETTPSARRRNPPIICRRVFRPATATFARSMN